MGFSVNPSVTNSQCGSGRDSVVLIEVGLDGWCAGLYCLVNSESAIHKVFRRNIASQDIPFRKRNWIFQFKSHSTYSPFPSKQFRNQVIHSWNTASKVSRSTPLKISWIADKSSPRSLNELPWSTPFRYPKIQKSEESYPANKENDLLGTENCDPKTG
jgi:hypothetical protein